MALASIAALDAARAVLLEVAAAHARDAERVTGWTLKPEYDADREQLRLTFTDRDGLPARITDIAVLVGRPTEAKDDQRPSMQREQGTFVAPVKLASGCDRRCTFCAIPSFRGSFVSRPPADVMAEIIWLAGEGVREVVLVSENSTSYGKDLGDLRALEALLPR